MEKTVSGFAKVAVALVWLSATSRKSVTSPVEAVPSCAIATEVTFTSSAPPAAIVKAKSVFAVSPVTKICGVGSSVAADTSTADWPRVYFEPTTGSPAASARRPEKRPRPVRPLATARNCSVRPCTALGGTLITIESERVCPFGTVTRPVAPLEMNSMIVLEGTDASGVVPKKRRTFTKSLVKAVFPAFTASGTCWIWILSR